MNQSASQVLLVAVRVSALYMNLTIIPCHHRRYYPIYNLRESLMIVQLIQSVLLMRGKIQSCTHKAIHFEVTSLGPQVHGTRRELTIRCLAGTGADPIHFHRHLDQIATCNPLANLSSQHAENTMRSCESISTTGLEIHSFMNLHLFFFSSGHD